MNKYTVFSIGLTPWQYQRVKYLAEINGESTARWLRGCVADKIERLLPTGGDEARLFEKIEMLKRKASGQAMLAPAEERVLSDG